jgi:hypothetical protein
MKTESENAVLEWRSDGGGAAICEVLCLAGGRPSPFQSGRGSFQTGNAAVQDLAEVWSAPVWRWFFTDFHLFPFVSTCFRGFQNKNIFWRARVCQRGIWQQERETRVNFLKLT